MAKLKDYPIADEYPYGEDLKKDVYVNTGVTKVSETDLNGSTTVNCDFYKWTKKTTYALTDRKKFVKIYQDELLVLLRLSSTASKVLMYAMTKLDKFTKRIEIITPACMGECGFKTRKSVTDGICELLEKEILIRTSEPMTYWISPIIVFNGDRMEFIREYVLEEE